jgi:hypothetical protein
MRYKTSQRSKVLTASLVSRPEHSGQINSLIFAEGCLLLDVQRFKSTPEEYPVYSIK